MFFLIRLEILVRWSAVNTNSTTLGVAIFAKCGRVYIVSAVLKNMSCVDFHNYLKNKQTLLNQISTNYNT